MSGNALRFRDTAYFEIRNEREYFTILTLHIGSRELNIYGHASPVEDVTSLIQSPNHSAPHTIFAIDFQNLKTVATKHVSCFSWFAQYTLQQFLLQQIDCDEIVSPR